MNVSELQQQQIDELDETYGEDGEAALLELQLI